jgi:hypothetical protein
MLLIVEIIDVDSFPVAVANFCFKVLHADALHLDFRLQRTGAK